MAGILQCVCLCGALLGFALCAAFRLWPYVRPRLGSGGARSVGVFLAAALGLCLWAGTKRPSGPSGVWITGDNGVRPVNSFATNDVAYLKWDIDSGFRPQPIPGDAAVYVECRPLDRSEDWRRLAAKVAGDRAFEGSIGAGLVATQYEYLVYSDYVRVSFANGVVMAGVNSASGDTVTVRWDRDAGYLPFPVPLTAPVFIDYRPLGSTNEWGMLGQAVVSDFAFTASVGAGIPAARFEYSVYSGYIPPVPVHTNGVWQVTGQWYEGQEGRRAMPLHMKFEGDGRVVYPRDLDSTGGH